MTDMERSRATLRRRDGRAYRMGGLLIGLVLVFDLLSVLAPGLMGLPLLPGGVVGAGVPFAFLIVLSVIAVAVIFVRRLNREDAAGGHPHDVPPG